MYDTFYVMTLYITYNHWHQSGLKKDPDVKSDYDQGLLLYTVFDLLHSMELNCWVGDT